MRDKNRIRFLADTDKNVREEKKLHLLSLKINNRKSILQKMSQASCVKLNVFAHCSYFDVLNELVTCAY